MAKASEGLFHKLTVRGRDGEPSASAARLLVELDGVAIKGCRSIVLRAKAGGMVEAFISIVAVPDIDVHADVEMIPPPCAQGG